MKYVPPPDNLPVESTGPDDLRAATRELVRVAMDVYFRSIRSDPQKPNHPDEELI